MAHEQPFRLVLRQAELGIGQIAKVEVGIVRGMAVNDRAKSLDPDAGIDHLARDAHVVQHLECTRRDADGAAVGQRLREAIDDAAAHVVTGELAGHDQPDRSGPDDEHVCHGRLLFLSGSF
jgi:hypothetical protein